MAFERHPKETDLMKLRSVLVMAMLAVGLGLSAWAADFNGKWTATFNTQMGEFAKEELVAKREK
jgi:hypothetical protein